MWENPPPIITDRLFLRIPRQEDVPAMVTCLNYWETVRYTANIPFPYLPRDAVLFIQRNQNLPVTALAGYAITRREDDQWIGMAGFKPLKEGAAYMGYMLGKPFFGKGYMREAVQGLIDDAFGRVGELMIIRAEVVRANMPSHRLLQLCGFQRGRSVLCQSPARGGEMPGWEYSLTRAEWEHPT